MTMDRTALTFEVVTLFPEMVRDYCAHSLVGRAQERGLMAVHCTDPREFASDKRRSVDDTPFGGGAGMVMRADQVVAALESIQAQRGPSHRVLLTPSAPRFDQAAARRLARCPRVTLICGRYEGIDDRVREHFVDEALSIGDFVLNGGELAALVLIEAVSRLLPGVLGNEDSAVTESFSADATLAAGVRLLEHPQYTRPVDFRGHLVPAVLQSGRHAAIANWRFATSLDRTARLRPELLATVVASLERPCRIKLIARDEHEAQSIARWIDTQRGSADATTIYVERLSLGGREVRPDASAAEQRKALRAMSRAHGGAGVIAVAVPGAASIAATNATGAALSPGGSAARAQDPRADARTGDAMLAGSRPLDEPTPAAPHSAAPPGHAPVFLNALAARIWVSGRLRADANPASPAADTGPTLILLADARWSADLLREGDAIYEPTGPVDTGISADRGGAASIDATHGLAIVPPMIESSQPDGGEADASHTWWQWLAVFREL